MTFLRPLQRRAAGLALLAALALALLPPLSRAFAPVDLAPAGAALCRADDGAGAAHLLDRCGHCLLAAAPWLPAEAPGRVRGASPGVVCPAAGLAGRPAGRVLGAAEARAPPAA